MGGQERIRAADQALALKQRTPVNTSNDPNHITIGFTGIAEKMLKQISGNQSKLNALAGGPATLDSLSTYGPDSSINVAKSMLGG
jgi:hypothetical protein